MNETPKFKNRENPQAQTTEGEKIFLARSTSLNGVLFMYEDEELKVLVVQRAEKMDQPFKWCLPCGYLDWDESCYEAVLREVYEETGIDIQEWKNFVSFDNNKRNFDVNSEPRDGKQNVAHSYVFYFDFEGVFQPRMHNFNTNDEVIKGQWVRVEDVFRRSTGLDWAFDHDEVIKLAYYEFLNRD